MNLEVTFNRTLSPTSYSPPVGRVFVRGSLPTSVRYDRMRVTTHLGLTVGWVENMTKSFDETK